MSRPEALTRLRTLLPPGSTLYAVLRGRSRTGGSVKVDFLAAAWQPATRYDPWQAPEACAAAFTLEWVTPHLLDAGVLHHSAPPGAPIRIPARGRGVRVVEPLDKASCQILETLGAMLHPDNPQSLRLEWI